MHGHVHGGWAFAGRPPNGPVRSHWQFRSHALSEAVRLPRQGDPMGEGNDSSKLVRLRSPGLWKRHAPRRTPAVDGTFQLASSNVLARPAGHDAASMTLERVVELAAGSVPSPGHTDVASPCARSGDQPVTWPGLPRPHPQDEPLTSSRWTQPPSWERPSRASKRSSATVSRMTDPTDSSRPRNGGEAPRFHANRFARIHFLPGQPPCAHTLASCIPKPLRRANSTNTLRTSSGVRRVVSITNASSAGRIGFGRLRSARFRSSTSA